MGGGGRAAVAAIGPEGGSRHDSPLYSAAMSGHSKWSRSSARRASTTSSGARSSPRSRGRSPSPRGPAAATPTRNFRLRLAIEKARAVNMPADNIKRAIDKATGGGEAEQFEEIVYEGYGPGGVAVLVEAATDNRNRTAAEVRSMFAKAGGQLAGIGRRRLAVRAARAHHGPARSGWTPTKWPSPRSMPAPRTSTPSRRSARDLHRAGRARGGPPDARGRPGSRSSRPSRR